MAMWNKVTTVNGKITSDITISADMLVTDLANLWILRDFEGDDMQVIFDVWENDGFETTEYRAVKRYPKEDKEVVIHYTKASKRR